MLKMQVLKYLKWVKMFVRVYAFHRNSWRLASELNERKYLSRLLKHIHLCG